MEKIIERYQVKSIHDIWPNLAFFVHGGVSFEPYKKGFEKLLARPLTYIETYLASEGFIAYQDRQHAKGMKLVTNEHIFLEFVPFNDENFDVEGNMTDNPEALMIHEVEEGRDYALLLKYRRRRLALSDWRYGSFHRQGALRDSDYRQNKTLPEPGRRTPKCRKHDQRRYSLPAKT